MAEQATNKTTIKMDEQQLDSLERAALHLYTELLPRMRGFGEANTAAKSFQLAKVFCDEAERIRAGGEIETVAVRTAAPEVVIHVWDPVKNRPEFDEYNNPIMVKQLGDPDAFAPNLDDNHPINQRYWKARQALNLSIPFEFRDAAAAAAASKKN